MEASYTGFCLAPQPIQTGGMTFEAMREALEVASEWLTPPPKGIEYTMKAQNVTLNNRTLKDAYKLILSALALSEEVDG